MMLYVLIQVQKRFFSFRDDGIKNGSYKSKFSQEEMIQRLYGDANSFIVKINEFDKNFKIDFEKDVYF
ncbi:MAG: hypothetical protein LBL77_00650 [Endomicrobium sp.]|jgi:hypothetical protein|nr:hypothetical protein [Endomicrobium sp.]